MKGKKEILEYGVNQKLLFGLIIVFKLLNFGVFYLFQIEKKNKKYDLLIIPHGDQHCEMLANNEDVIKMLKS